MFEVNITNVTHTLIGGYDTLTYREYDKSIKISEPLRTSEIKSLLRYWTRATIGAAAISLGYEPKELAVNIPKLFLGSTSLPWGGSIQSAYQVQVSIERLEKCVRAKELARYIEVSTLRARRTQLVHPPRIQLLKLTGETIYMYKPYALKAIVRLIERDYVFKALGNKMASIKRVIPFIRKVAIGSLLIGLALSGIGAITRRGFGSLKPIEILSIEDDKLRSTAKVFVKGEWNEVKNKLKNLIETIENEAKTLLDTLSDEDKLKKCYKKLENVSHFIPTISTVHRNWCVIYMIELKDENVIEWYEKHKQSSSRSPGLIKVPSNVDMYDKLICIGETYSRTCPLGCLGRHITINSIVGNLIHVQIHDPQKPRLKEPKAWILGLPRFQRDTGYKIEEKGVERRVSPLLYSFLNENILIASIIASRDWPRLLLWKGRGKGRQKHVNVKRLIETCEFKSLLKDLEKHMKKFFKDIGCRVEKIYP